jgi:hypothetical protein
MKVSTEEIIGQEAESALKEGEKHHDFMVLIMLIPMTRRQSYS